MTTYKIALIPGDGIGTAVIDATWEVLNKAAAGAGFSLDGTSFPWSCEFYEKTGALAMPGPYERNRFLALELSAGALDGANGVLKASGRKAKPARVLFARAA